MHLFGDGDTDNRCWSNVNVWIENHGQLSNDFADIVAVFTFCVSPLHVTYMSVCDFPTKI